MRLCCRVMLVGVLLFCGHALVYASHGVWVGVGPPRTAAPGDLVTHVFTVENTGTLPDQYRLTIKAPAGWTFLPVADQVVLSPGERTRVFVTLIAPIGAEAGSYSTELRATSLHDQAVSHAAKGKVELLPKVDVRVEIIHVDRVAPGEEAQHTVRVSNRGNVTDTYSVEVRGSPAWTVRVSPAEFAVLPGAQRDVNIHVGIPRAVAPGTQYRVRVDVVSRTDPGVTDMLWLPAVVAPPPPEKVRVEFYPELPLTLRLTLAEDGNPSLRLSLAGSVPDVGRVTATRGLRIFGITEQAAGFHSADWGVDWGRVSVSGGFAGVSGEGLRVQWNEPEHRTVQIALTDAGQGLAGSLRWDDGMLRVVTTRTEGVSDELIAEVQAQGRLSETLSLWALVAQGWAGQDEGSAFRISPTMRVGDVAGFLELERVTRGFPGQTAYDAHGWRLSLGTGMAPLQGTVSVKRTVSLMDLGSPLAHATTDAFSGSITLRPTAGATGLLTLHTVVAVSDDEPPTTDRGSLTVNLRYTELGQQVTWSLSGTHRTERDDVTNTRSSTDRVSVSGRAYWGQITVRGRLSIEQDRDLVSSGASAFSTSLSISCSLAQLPLSPSVSLLIRGGSAALSTSVSWTDAAGWNMSAMLELPLDAAGGFALSSTVSLPVSFRLFGPVYGVVRGRAFVDTEGTGLFDEGDEPIADLVLEVNGSEAITGTDGRFVFFPFRPGRHEVDIVDLPFGLHPLVDLPLTVNLKAGESAELLIPLESKSVVRGTVFHDLDRDGQRSAGEPGIAGVDLLITGPTVQKQVKTDDGGRFAVEVPAGRYTVELLPVSLPARFEPTTPTTTQVAVGERAWVTVDLGAWERPRPVVVGPVGPIPYFQHEPDVLRVDHEATFDAGASEVVGDETIVTYAWAFRLGPTVLEARGENVTVVFEHPGNWVVTLRVVDSAGRTAQTQRIVTVR